MEKNLKKLNRRELLELLLKVTENNEALMAENAQLRESTQVRLSQSATVGSIAQAALEANGYFEVVQKSADDYLREVKWLRDQLAGRYEGAVARGEVSAVQGAQGAQQAYASESMEHIKEQAQAYIKDVQAYANDIVAQANAQAESILAGAQERSQAVVARTNEQARDFVERVNAKGASVIEGANAKAASIVEDANARAEAIVGDANAQARGILDDANMRARDVLAQADVAAGEALLAAAQARQGGESAAAGAAETGRIELASDQQGAQPVGQPDAQAHVLPSEQGIQEQAAHVMPQADAGQAVPGEVADADGRRSAHASAQPRRSDSSTTGQLFARGRHARIASAGA